MFKNADARHTTEIIRIRPALPTDVSALIEIQEKCRLSGWSEKDYIAELDNADTKLTVAAVAEQKVAGFALARFTADRLELDLLNIGILPEFQKRGIGKRLLNAVIEQASENKKTGTIWLEVRESNLNAVNFYLKNRFRTVQRRKNFYTHPTEDGLIMRLDL